MKDKIKTKSSWTDKLKNRWGISSTFQVIFILVIFACTGISVMYAEDFIFRQLGSPQKENWVIRILIFIFITLPLYNLFLLIFGFIFGQFSFFWNFEKRFFRRLFTKFRKKSQGS